MRENNQAAGKTWTYAYDDGGNIQSKTEYAYTTGSLGAAERTVAYGYGDASWSDLLTSIDGQSLTADEIGNLLSDGTWAYTWQHGRQLAGMSKSGTNIAYGYDSDGRRITKTVNGTTYNYHYLGDQLVELTWGGNKLHFTYDSTGPLSMNYNGTEYFYVKNAQGDVTGLVSASGTRVVTYTYDAWGNLLTTTGSMATTLGAANPLRYRGYVYDTETGLYYLQSRYYNPGWGRFINADDTTLLASSPSKAHWDKNVFAYCDNNPVIRIDDEGGYWDLVIGAFVGGVVSGGMSLLSAYRSDEPIDWGKVLIDAATGAISGALSVVEVNWLVTVAESFISNAISQEYEILSGKRQDFDVVEMGISMATDLALGKWGDEISDVALKPVERTKKSVAQKASSYNQKAASRKSQSKSTSYYKKRADKNTKLQKKYSNIWVAGKAAITSFISSLKSFIR